MGLYTQDKSWNDFFKRETFIDENGEPPFGTCWQQFYNSSGHDMIYNAHFLRGLSSWRFELEVFHLETASKNVLTSQFGRVWGSLIDQSHDHGYGCFTLQRCIAFCFQIQKNRSITQPYEGIELSEQLKLFIYLLYNSDL